MTSPRLTIFKQSSRYSEIDRPALQEQCFFSHALSLTRTEFVPFAKIFDRKELHQNALCVVKRNMPHVCEVLFNDSLQTDLVSPEFLTSIELTSFGKELVDAVGIQAAQTILGEVKK